MSNELIPTLIVMFALFVMVLLFVLLELEGIGKTLKKIEEKL